MHRSHGWHHAGRLPHLPMAHLDPLCCNVHAGYGLTKSDCAGLSRPSSRFCSALELVSFPGPDDDDRADSLGLRTPRSLMHLCCIQRLASSARPFHPSLSTPSPCLNRATHYPWCRSLTCMPLSSLYCHGHAEQGHSKLPGTTISNGWTTSAWKFSCRVEHITLCAPQRRALPSTPCSASWSSAGQYFVWEAGLQYCARSWTCNQRGLASAELLCLQGCIEGSTTLRWRLYGQILWQLATGGAHHAWPVGTQSCNSIAQHPPRRWKGLHLDTGNVLLLASGKV